MTIPEIIKAFIQSCIGLPYRWGGDDALEGFDCSGFIIELFTSVGMWDGSDTTAQGLYNHFKPSSPSVLTPQFGDLAFYGSSVNKITHIAFIVNPTTIFEFGGGGSRTTTREAAIQQNACGRFRPIARRKDLVAVLRPRWS